MSVESKLSPKRIASTLSEDDYNRQRRDPNVSDDYYIPLSDLRIFLENHIRPHYDVILDMGCGGAPYQSIFKSSAYLKADFVQCVGLDAIIKEDGSVDIPSNSCDLVLSTQVLEHVFDPEAYLAEALRVLKPGGKLFLTTHGVWEDHGCPFDFWRWTADGLRKTVEAAGFSVQNSMKLTTGKRAVIFLAGRHFSMARPSLRSLSGWFLLLLRYSFFGSNGSRHKWIDDKWPGNRAVQADVPGHTFYLGLGMVASKPEQ